MIDDPLFEDDISNVTQNDLLEVKCERACPWQVKCSRARTTYSLKDMSFQLHACIISMPMTII